MIGVALATAQVDGREPRAGGVAAEQFSAGTPDNAMKRQPSIRSLIAMISRRADAYVEFASRYSMSAIGCALVWAK